MKIKGLDKFMGEPISYEKIASEDQVYKISKLILADREEYGRNVARGIIERLIERTKAVNKAGRDGLSVQDLRMFAAEYGVFLEGKDDQNVSCNEQENRRHFAAGRIQAEQYAAQYIEELQAENAALRERLEKAVELPRVECIMTREWLSRELIGAIMFEWCVLYKKGGYLMAEPCLSKEAAEIRLAELKGEKK